MTQSQSQSDTQKERQLTQTVDYISDRMLYSAVRAILNLDARKKPMKKMEILSVLSTKPKKNLLDEFWIEVEVKLNGLGKKLVEVPESNPKTYMLISENPDLPLMAKYHSQEERADRTLIILALAFMLMKNGTVTEDELFRHLTQFHIITEGNSIHDYFGDVKRKISTQFVEQGYFIKYTENEVTNFSWGQRAELEISKLSILEFICKVGYNGRHQPADFSSHFADVNIPK